jgi:hypothetical protein
MAAHYKDNLLHGRDHTDDHGSDNRWRHQESDAFHRHAGKTVGTREADARHGSKDLADFFNSTRIEPPRSDGSGTGKFQPIMAAGNAHNGPSTGQSLATQHDGAQARDGAVGSKNTLEVKCGPLLNYRRMENETWFGSVLVVTRWGGSDESSITPELILKIVGNVQPAGAPSTQGQSVEGGANEAGKEPYGVVNGVDYGSGQAPTSSTQIPSKGTDTNAAITEVGKDYWEVKVKGTRLYSDPANTFWRFSLEVPMQQAEIQCEYTLSGVEFTQEKRADKQHFFIPAITESMRIMFHSCNGFSVGTNEAAWSGACLWNDVIRVHQKTPFHVM